MINRPSARYCPLIAGLIICTLSATAFLINHFYFHFIGNNYIPAGVEDAGFKLLLIFLGVKVYFDKNHYISELTASVITFYWVVATLAILTNATELTPFSPIDGFLIGWEHFCHIDMAAIVSWTARHPLLKNLLMRAYDSLVWQMTIIPLAMAVLAQFSRLKEYYCLLLLSAMIGFGFYYFFPTVAPASMINSPFFSADQHATGIKFREIHNHLAPSTLAGGMIGFPSFHVIWALLCLYLVYPFRLVFLFLLPINILLIFSCVLLGWHYPEDLPGSLAVLCLAYAIRKCFK